jgi:hypothetical protein
MKGFHIFFLYVVAIMVIVTVQPAMAVVNMNSIDISGLDNQSNPSDASDWSGSPGENQMHDSFSAILVPVSEWFSSISIPRSDGNNWFPYSNGGPESFSTETRIDWSEEHVTPADLSGWWSPITPSEVPDSFTVNPAPALPAVLDNTIPMNPDGWWNPLIPAEIEFGPRDNHPAFV